MREVFGPTRGSRLLYGGLLVGALALDVLMLVASVAERDLFLLALGAVTLGPVTLLAVYLLARSEQRFTLEGDHVEARGLLWRRRVPLAAITAVDNGDRFTIRAEGRAPLRVRLSHRDRGVPLESALIERSPQLRAALSDVPRLPISFARRPSVSWVNSLLALAGALFFLAFGAAMVVGGLVSIGGGEVSSVLGPLLMSMLACPFGLLFAWMGLMDIPWGYRFTEEHAEVRFALRKKRYPRAALAGMALRSEERVTRGVSRTAWVLALELGEHGTLNVEPTEGGVPMGFTPDADRRDLARLQAALRAAWVR